MSKKKLARENESYKKLYRYSRTELKDIILFLEFRNIYIHTNSQCKNSLIFSRISSESWFCQLVIPFWK